jgi:hypothetical protein
LNISGKFVIHHCAEYSIGGLSIVGQCVNWPGVNVREKTCRESLKGLHARLNHGTKAVILMNGCCTTLSCQCPVQTKTRQSVGLCMPR